MAKNSFIFYTSYAEPMKELSDRNFRRVVEAMIQLTLGEEPTELPGAAKIAFGFIRPMLEIDMKKHAEVCRQNRENALSGAKKRKAAIAASRTKSLPEYEYEDETETEAETEDETEKETEKDSADEDVKENGSETGSETETETEEGSGTEDETRAGANGGMWKTPAPDVENSSEPPLPSFEEVAAWYRSSGHSHRFH